MNVAGIVREFHEVPTHLIDEPALPSRSTMDEDQMQELVTSIRANGLIQPISVARKADRYEVIAGHRRRVASGLAGLPMMPCVVYPSRADALDAIQYAENRHREALSAADEAIWFSELLERKCEGDTDKLCALVGERRAYVEGRLALFMGCADVFGALQANKISIGVAHELNKCPDAHYRKYYLEHAIRGGATIAIVAAWLMEWKNMFGGPQRPAEPVAPSEAGIVTEPHNPFTCEVCGRADNVHLIRQISVHQHCKLAILDPMLTAYHGNT